LVRRRRCWLEVGCWEARCSVYCRLGG
jgi:hypothetical protein